LNPENKNIKFSKRIFQDPLNGTNTCQNWFFLPKYRSYELKVSKSAYNHSIWTKTHTNRGNWFWAKYADFQNIENLKKNEVFQLQVKVGKKVVTSKKWKIC
jgi:hypothetical protein